MIEAVLFDVDGVLVHPWRFRDLLTSKYGITPAMTAPFFRDPFKDCVLGRADLVDILPPFLASWGWQGSTTAFLDEWFSSENAPDEAVLDVVADLRRRRIPCFAASTQERRRARYLASEMRFEQLFDRLFFSCDIGAAKPHQDFYVAVASHLGCAGANLLFFDDLDANVEGARTAGWRAEPFTTVERLRADLAAHIGLAAD